MSKKEIHQEIIKIIKERETIISQNAEYFLNNSKKEKDISKRYKKIIQYCNCYQFKKKDIEYEKMFYENINIIVYKAKVNSREFMDIEI
ncbi:40916_t:CDS:1, partial [Gigaspora margarita]